MRDGLDIPQIVFGRFRKTPLSPSFRHTRVSPPSMAARSHQKRNYLFNFPLPAAPTHRSLLQEAQDLPRANAAPATQDEVVAHLASLSVATPKIPSSPTAPLSPVGTSLLATRRLNQKKRSTTDSSQASSTMSSTQGGPPRSEPARAMPVSLLQRRDVGTSAAKTMQQHEAILTASLSGESRMGWVLDL